jgi:large repetitive protein
MSARAPQRLRALVAVPVTLALALATLVVPAITGAIPSAQAAAPSSPAVQLQRQVAASTLYGKDVAVTLEATTAATEPDAYNLSFDDILPVGATVTTSDFPYTKITQGDGTTRLVWSNVADLLAGATVDLHYTFSYATIATTPVPTKVYDVGDTFTGTADAYVSKDPRMVPKPDATGATWTSADGYASNASTTKLVPFTVTTVEERSPDEHELLRGVHADKTSFKIVVTNNTIAATSSVSITDYLPAALEYLGCTAADHSAGQEYAGSGDLTGGFPPMTSCDSAYTARVVTTHGDPNVSDGVYTKVVWGGIGVLQPGDVTTLQFAAAIPMHANVDTGSTADATADLDDNTGAEAADEQVITTTAVASGSYQGGHSTATVYEVKATAIVTAEDVRIVKSVAESKIAQGETSHWTLAVASSEYTLSTGQIVVTDVIPDGLDYDAGSANVTPTNVAAPASNGTITVTWTLPAFTAPQQTASITYTTTTRSTYRATSSVVAANDSWTNTTHLVTSTTERTGPTGAATRAVATVIDDSAASQQADGIVIRKQVGAPVGGSCSSTTTWQSEAGTFHPGDTVCFLLTVTFPTSLDTVGTVVTDFLPAGFAYQSYAYTPQHDISPSAITFASAGPKLTWTDSQIDKGTHFSAVVTTTITDTTAQTVDIAGNLLKVKYANTAKQTFQLRDLASADLGAPVLGLTKQLTSAATAQSGDPATFKITVTNTGKQDAEHVEVWDVLPAGWACSDIAASTFSGGADCATRTGAANPAIRWTGLTVAAGGSTVLTVTATMPNNASPADADTDTAGVRGYDGATNGGGDFSYVPANNIDSTRTTTNAPRADAQATVKVRNATVTKTVTTSVNESGNDTATQATVGETLTYTVTAMIPQGTTMYGSPWLDDPVSSSLAIVPGSASYTVNGGAATAATISGSTISVPIASGSYSSQAASDDHVVLTYQATVADVAAAKRGAVIANVATLHWKNANNVQRTAANPAVNVTVVEPNLTITQSTDATGNQIVAGQIVTYTVTTTNTNAASVATAHDTVVVETLPADQLTPLKAGDVPAQNGDTLPSGAVWDSSAHTLTWPAIATLAPAASQASTFRAQVQSPLLAGTSIPTTAVATTTSMTGTPAGERTATTAATSSVTGYRTSAPNTLTGPVFTIAKSGTPGSRTAGQHVDYTVTVTVPKSVWGDDVTVIDTLPAGIRFGALKSQSCTGGCDLNAPPIAVIGSPSTSDRTIGFDVGDIASMTADRTITFTYDGVVTTTAASGSQSNQATLYYDATDKRTGTPSSVPAPSSFDRNVGPASAAVTVTRPQLTIDKNVVGQVGDSDTRRAVPGQVLTYTITVANSGTSDADDIEVSDTPDRRMTDYTPGTMTGVTATDTDPSDGSLGWVIPGPIAAGGSLTFSYSLTVPSTLTAADENVSGPELLNTASIPHYYGVPAAERSPKDDFATYSDVTPDTVSIELDLASIGDRVWYDRNGDGVQDAGEPGIAGVKVDVTYLGADGTPNTADDEKHVATTDVNGNWTVDHLPGGKYLVALEANTLPAGTKASYDLDGGTAAPNRAWQGTLAENAVKTDVDFGETGTGSIGDRVWFDENRNGAQDAGEGGISGATVTVVWAGPDGTFGTPDDLTWTRTTSATGAYSVTGLRPGAYTVTVSGIPSGAQFVSDPDGGAADGTETITLNAGQNRTADDFGLAGTGSIGDTVWLDRDGDGVQQPATEPGIAGATVTLRWAGADGAFNTADDTALTTTTGTDGKYGYANLLPGAYRVAVTNGVGAAANTHDRDGNKDSSTDVTLADGQAVADADFGYHASTALGGTVWWDRSGDGVQDAGEPGLRGVTVTATATDGSQVARSTTTDTDGHWSITNLLPGTYTVTVSGVPAGFAPTWDTDGVATPNTTTATISSSGITPDQDFGYRGAGAIGHAVWLDRNADGVRQSDDPGIPGATVTLTWTDPTGHDVVLTTTTAADGSYGFDHLPDGAFRIAVSHLPAGLTPSADPDPGAPDGRSTVTLTNGSQELTQDFGYAGSGSVGDTVWLDGDADGKVGTGEAGIPDVGIALVWAGADGALGTADDVTWTATTDAHGRYGFAHLPAGLFQVSVTSGIAADLTQTADPDAVKDGSTQLTLAAGGSDQDADFGYIGDPAVGDTVYIDLNGNGVQDANEPGIPNVVITWVQAGADGHLGTSDDLTGTVTTDANGHYLIPGLPDGDVTVSYDPSTMPTLSPEADRDGTTAATGGTDATTTVTLAGADVLDADFALVGHGALDGVLWDDVNGDGVQQASEKPLAGVAVTVTWLDHVGGPITIPVTTKADGTWQLTTLPVGQYTASVDPGTALAGSHFSLKPVTVSVAGGIRAHIPMAVTLATLALTGLNVGGIVLFALLALAFGLAAAVVARRRRLTPRHRV